MASHANYLPPSIDDYFRIIDPSGKLSPQERICKMNDVLDNLPRSFPKALCCMMELSGMTIEALEEASMVSCRTISRYRTGEAKSYSEDKIVAMCVAMRLPPWLSRELIEKAGFRLAETRRQRTCMRILDCINTYFIVPKCYPTLKYTQSNSVCYAVDGQAIGVGAGQQSRIHCTRLAGSKADTWFLRQHPKTLNLPFRADLGRPNRDNVIDSYINGNEEDVCADGIWQDYFTEQPERLTEGDKRAWLSSRRNVALGSDAFFPFSDNIKRAFASGVKYIAEPGGSIRDDLVIEECNKKDMVIGC